MKRPTTEMLVGLLIVILVAFGISLCMGPAHAARAKRTGLSVYDGDTFSIAQERFRIAGVDAPEIGWRARCPEELELATKAREEVRAFMARPYVLRKAPGRDRYGRTLIYVEVEGKGLTEHLIASGLGVPYKGRGKRMDWCHGKPGKRFHGKAHWEQEERQRVRP